MHRFLFPLISSILLVLSGCGSPDGSTWLIRTSAGDITVSEVGTTWNELDNTTRMKFLSGDNPVGDFITALGRKTMVTMEIDNETYLHSSVIQTMKKCWAQSAAFIAYKDTLAVMEMRNISETDFANYADLLGSVVWYTSSIHGHKGPERLPDLPWNLAFAFDSVTAGSTVETDGVSYTLDSIITADPELVAATLADTSQFRTFVRNSLVESRVNTDLETMKFLALETLVIDSAEVFSYCAARDSLDDSTQLASWDSGSITAGDFDGITAFLSLSGNNFSSSPAWVFHNLENQVRLQYIAGRYAGEYPDEYSVIAQRAEAFAVDQASELLFRNNVTETVTVTDSMVSAEYAVMDTVPTLPESRIFESVVAPADSVDILIALMDSGTDLLQTGFRGYPEFLSDSSDFVSRPVFRSELPGEMDLTLFLLDEDDNQWQRPVEVREGSFVFYRLVQVIPPHEAQFDYLEPYIRENLHMHLEEQRTMEWMRELEASYEFHINSNILGELPADPSAWSEL